MAFSLLNNSPGINGGIVTFRTYDFFGENLVETPDIGAIEH